MKMKGAKQVHYDSGPNMTPLVDVVMVILIFLMLAGNFGGATQFLISKQGIHKTGHGNPGPIDPNQPPDIDVQVDQLPNGPDGKPAGFVALVPGNKPTNSRKAVKESLDALRAKYVGQGTAPDKLQVVIHPSRSLQHKFLIQVYDSALRAKYEKISFATSH